MRSIIDFRYCHCGEAEGRRSNLYARIPSVTKSAVVRYAFNIDRRRRMGRAKMTLLAKIVVELSPGFNLDKGRLGSYNANENHFQ